jgi:hypothetical protein
MTEHDTRQSDEGITATDGQSVWGKPPSASERQEHSERRYSILSNLLTLLFTGLIIAGGFLLPTLLYPYLDSYRDETMQLTRPSESALAEHVFDEPVTLYPWNIYESGGESLRPLSLAERDLLDIRGIPDFLVATLRDHGLPMDSDEGGYRTQIINAFRYLEPDSGTEPGCFILGDTGDFDIDADGQADFRCAVDYDGNIISLIFITSQWESLQIEAPIGVASTPTVAGEQGEQTGQAGQGEQGEQGEQAGQATAPTGPGAGTGDVEEDPAIEGPAGDDTGGTVGDTTTQPQVEHLPVEEDRYLWAFVYATAREAHLIDQTELFSAFRQLELTYEYRYGYPFTMLLPVQPVEPEALPEIAPTALTPTVLTTGEYLLSIYDLPSGERLVLYLNPANRHCMGFNLLRY